MPFVLGRLSPDLCRAITGDAESADLLGQLERQELFLLPLDDERQWFRYHHLFAKFLQQRLERQDPQQIKKLHLAAARWFSEHGQTADALDHALAGDNVSLAIDLVEQDARALIQNSYMATVLGLVAQLPRAQVVQRASLQTSIAWAHCLMHHPREAEESLFNIERATERSSAEAKKILLGEVNVIRGCNAVYADEIDAVEELTQPCIEDRASYSPWVVGVAANVLTYCYIHRGEMHRVAPLQAWAREYQDRAEGLFSGVYGRCFSGMAELATGDLRAAKRLFVDAVALARRTTGRQSHAAKLAGALLGQIQYEMNELEDAAQLLEESRILGFEGGVVDTYLATYIASARLCVQRGDRDAAIEALREGEATARHLKLDRLAASIATEQVRFWLQEGDHVAARRALADFGLQLADTEPKSAGVSAQVWECLQQANALILADQGRFDLAIPIIRNLLQRAKDSGRHYFSIRLSIALGVLIDLSGGRLEAEELVGCAVTRGMQCGMVRGILDEGPQVIRILERLRDKANSQTDSTHALTSFGASAEQLIAIANDPDRGFRASTKTSKTALAETLAVSRFNGSLKPREIEILHYLNQGRSNKEIARTLNISVDTVKWYLKTVFAKLGVARRGQAIAEARRLHMLEPS